MICPKCQYQRTEHDAHVLAGVCPACGIAYIKWQEAREAENRCQSHNSSAQIGEDQTSIKNYDSDTCFPPSAWQVQEPFWLRLYHYACFMPSDRHESAFWGHSALYLIFLVWGWRFILNGVDWAFIGSSFLHNPNLAFHEFGHVAFSGFGPFWMLLGGSLFQIILPLFPLFAFMVQQRDNFPASIMLWWCGQNFIDVSPYIADAPIRAIPLTTGNDDSHDWWNLLLMTDSLQLAGFYANLCFALGAAVIIFSNIWGAHLLWIEFHGRTHTGNTEVQE